MNKQYAGLPPGVHFYVGDHKIKSLSLTAAQQWEHFGILNRDKSAETLFASVAWVHIALTHRRNMIGEIAVDWERNGEKVEQPPVNFDSIRELPRIDQAIQLGGVAYLYKLRRGARMLGLRWLDPAAIEPDDVTMPAAGFQRYRYTTNTGTVYLPAEDVIRFYNAGQREHVPEPAAGGAASLAGQILLGMGETADTFFDTNGLPVIAVIVPDATSAEQLDSMADRFRRLFQSKRSLGGNKTVGLRAGTDIKVISFAPKDLAMAELSDSKVDEILLAHGVPTTVRTTVNRAEAEWKTIGFVNTIASRLGMIANTLNEDEDIARTGVLLAVHKERHEMMQQMELSKAESLMMLAGRPVITVNEARERLELEPLQGGDDVAPPAPANPFERQEQDEEPVNDAKAVELVRLRRFVKSGKWQERQFHSAILTLPEIQAVMLQEGAYADDAPFQGYP